MSTRNTQEFKGWQRIFKAGLEAGFKGIQLQEGAHPAAQEGAQAPPKLKRGAWLLKHGKPLKPSGAKLN